LQHQPCIYGRRPRRQRLRSYSTETCSSSKIEARTYEDVAFRYLPADEHPDQGAIAEFHKRPLDALAGCSRRPCCARRRAWSSSGTLPDQDAEPAKPEPNRLNPKPSPSAGVPTDRSSSLEWSATSPILESRIMPSGVSKGSFVLGSNAQIEVEPKRRS